MGRIRSQGVGAGAKVPEQESRCQSARAQAKVLEQEVRYVRFKGSVNSEPQTPATALPSRRCGPLRRGGKELGHLLDLLHLVQVLDILKLLHLGPQKDVPE